MPAKIETALCAVTAHNKCINQAWSESFFCQLEGKKTRKIKNTESVKLCMKRCRLSCMHLKVKLVVFSSDTLNIRTMDFSYMFQLYFGNKKLILCNLVRVISTCYTIIDVFSENCAQTYFFCNFSIVYFQIFITKYFYHSYYRLKMFHKKK